MAYLTTQLGVRLTTIGGGWISNLSGDDLITNDMSYTKILYAINATVAAAGGTGTATKKITALNELCTLQGVTAGHSKNLAALNAIDAGLGGTGTHAKHLDANNSISALISGAGNYTKNLDAWNEIAGIGLLDTSLFEFLWVAGNFDGDNLLSSLDTDVLTVTGKDFSTDYIPVTSTATFAIPDTATYKDADTDNFWHSGETILQKTVTQLISTDNNRTFIKYADEAPHHITAIGILKSSVTLTDAQKDRISGYFWLWLYYFGTLNDYGHLKENRPVEEDPYCPQFRAVYDSWTNKPSESVATAMDTMVRALVDGGVWAKLDCFEFYGVHNNDAGEALKDWVNLSRTVSIVNSPTFTAYQGFAGIIANSTRINTGWNPSESTKFTQNDNCWGIYNRKARNASSTKQHGIETASCILLMNFRSGSSYLLHYNNSLTACSSTPTTTTSEGFWHSRRNSATEADGFKNNTEIAANKAANSAARLNQEMELLCRNNAGTRTYNDEEISLFYAASYLNDTELATLTNAVEAYMDSNSKGVIA